MKKPKKKNLRKKALDVKNADQIRGGTPANVHKLHVDNQSIDAGMSEAQEKASVVR